MYRFKINIKMKCSNHPMYNPEKQSPKVCKECTRLFYIHQKALALRQAMAEE